MEINMTTTDDSRLDFIHSEYSDKPEGYYTDEYNSFLREYYGAELLEEMSDSEIATWFIQEWS